MSRVDLRAMPDEELYRLYADRSRTLVAIAADIGWHANSLAVLGAAAADRLGLPRRRPVPPQAAQARARRERVRELYAEGVTLREIARRCGAGYATVLNDTQQLKAAGTLVKPSPPHLQPDRSRYDTPLARARVRAGMTQLELAERSGVSLETTCRMEAGAARPHAKTAARLAAAVGASADLLWPEVQWPDPTAVVPPPHAGIPHGDGDPVHERRLAVAALYAKDTAPGAIARLLEVGRATVYRDLAYLRDCGWELPGRPYGRPPTPHGSADIGEQGPGD